MNNDTDAFHAEDNLEGQLIALFATDSSASALGMLDARVRPIIAASRMSSKGQQWRLMRWLIQGAVGSTVAIVVGIAVMPFVSGPTVVNPSAAPGAAPVTLVRDTNAYPLDDAPAAAAAFPGNRAILVGTVTSVGPARWSGLDRDTAHIYVPVEVDVAEVWKGDVPDATVSVRSLGGEVDGVRMEVPDGVPIAELQHGTRVLLFLGDEAPVSGPQPVNMAYTISAQGCAASFPGAEHSITLADFRGLIAGSSSVVADSC